MMKQYDLTFLKLGGSLITNKSQPLTPRKALINRLCGEIAQTMKLLPGSRLLIGHGSGSFGHTIASQYQTQQGGEGSGYWQGFADVWHAARSLNQIIIDNFAEVDLPVIAFPPSSGIISQDQTIQSWDVRPIRSALDHYLVPIVQGDVVFDTALGGTILSTEQVFIHLAENLLPQRILMAGLDPGVFKDHEKPDDIIVHITPQTIEKVLPTLSGAKASDVTGGMRSKVMLMANLVQKIPNIEVQIFSGFEKGNIQKALQGERLGTLITA